MTSTKQDFNDKRVLVLGAGKEGIATIDFLYSNYPNARLHIADKKELTLNVSGVQTLCGNKYPTSLSEFDVIVVSPGIPPRDSLLQTATNITTATNIFFEHVKGTVVGVTGSKGKSTTSALIHAMLDQAGKNTFLVGNIGNPALAELQNHNNESDIFVFELSSYQIRLLERGPSISVITTLFPDHIDYHGSVEQYYADKLHIVDVLSDKQTLIYNGENKELASRISRKGKTTMAWPEAADAHIEEDALFIGSECILPLSAVPLLGTHNLSNILGAITTASYMGVEANSIAEAIMNFTALPHRLQLVGVHNNITFYNDSLSTTPESTIAAIQSLESIGTLFLGGQDRGYNFSALAALIAEKKIPNIVLFPDSGETMLTEIKKTGHIPHTLATSSMKEAVQFAYANSPSGSTCLLSCASPSCSIFRDYKDRGDQFIEAVEELASKGKKVR